MPRLPTFDTGSPKGAISVYAANDQPTDDRGGGLAVLGLRLFFAQRLQRSAADTLAWFLTLPAERQAKLRAGITLEREADLLVKLRA